MLKLIHILHNIFSHGIKFSLPQLRLRETKENEPQSSTHDFFHPLGTGNRKNHPSSIKNTFLSTFSLFLFLTTTVTLTNAQPLSPVTPKANAILASSPTLFQWNSKDDAINYKFELASDSLFSSIIYQTTTTDLQATNPVTLPPNNYFWRIIAFYPLLPNDTSIINKFLLFLPTQVPNLKFWLSADSCKISDGNKVDTLYDKSGNNFFACQSALSKRPNIINNGIGNCPAIEFTGSQLLNGNGLVGDLTQYSFFVVTKINEYINFNWIYHNAPGDINSSFSLSTANSNKIIFWNDGLYSNYYIPNTYTTNQNYIFNINNNNSLTSNKTQFYCNKILVGNNNLNTSTHTNNGYKIGACISESLFFKGLISEMILTGQKLTDSQRENIENYLVNKYAPPVSLGYDIKTSLLCDTAIIGADKSWFNHWQWNTGDTSSIIRVNQSGKYWVNATNIFGTISSDTILVNFIGHQQFPDTTICFGDTLTYYYDNNFAYNITWSNGDTGSTFKTAHSGNYSISLLDSKGCLFQTQFTVSIDSFPFKNILSNDTTICSGNRIQIFPTQGLQSLLWSPGNDTTQYKTIYESNTYKVRATNNRFCVLNDSITVNIQGIAPTPLFQWSTLCNRDTIHFTDLSFPIDSIITWKWNINNGYSSLTQNAITIFDTNGVFNVNLQIESHSGCKKDTTVAIYVNKKPTANFTYQAPCPQIPTEFTNLSDLNQGYVTQMTYWSIDNILASTEINPQLNFPNSQSYNVSLKVTTTNLCSDSISKSIYIPSSYPLPSAFSTILPQNNILLTNPTILFQWNASENAQFYKFELSDTSNFSNIIYSTKLFASNYPGINYSVTNRGFYFWRVKAYNACLDSITSISNTFQFYTPNYSNLRFWVAADSCKVSDGNKIDTVYDKSGNNYFAWQSDITKRPNLKDNTIGGHPVIEFTGTQFLNGNGLVGDLTEYSFFVVAKFNEFVNYNWLYHNAPLGNYNSSFSFSTANSNKLIFWNDGAYDNGILPNTYSTSLYYILNSNNSNNSSVDKNQFYCNKSYIGSNNKNTTTHPNNGYKIGAFLTGSLLFKGEIAEMILIDEKLPDSQRENIEKYLINKYAPPVSLGYDIKTNQLCDISITGANKPWFTNWLWNTGDTTSSIPISHSGTYWVRTTDIFGLQSSDTVVVYFEGKRTLPDTTFCLGDSYQYTWQPLTNYTLNWSNGNIGSTFTETQAGSYSFLLTDTMGCTYRDTFNLFVDSLALRMTLGDDTSLCGGNTLHYTLNNYTLNNPLYLWSNGDITETTTTDTTNDYWLQITNNHGCIARDTIHVFVRGKAPFVSFTAPGKCLGETTSFNDLSHPQDPYSVINQWQWDFGDGNNASTQNTTHNYANPGIYPITLTITTDSNCSNSLTLPTVVYTLPEVGFTPVLGCSNTPIQFTDNTQYTDNYTIDQWQWDFGDLQSGTSNLSNIQHPEHLFDTAGIYSITLRATSIVGCSDFLTQSITIRPAPTGNFTASNTCNGETTWFNDSTIAEIWNPVTSSEWIFDNESSSNLAVTSKKYDAPGSYPVTYIITTLNGCTDTVQKMVSVYAVPVANFSANSFCLNEPIVLESNSTVENDIITGHQWTIDNQVLGVTSPITLQFDSANSYPVQLNVTTAHQCKDSITQTVVIKPVPHAQFTYNYDEHSIGYQIQFTNSTTGGFSYEWFNKSTLFSTQTEPQYDFGTEGNYPILMIATNSEGCSDSTSATILVSSPVMDIAITNLIIAAVGNYRQATAYLMNMSNRNITDLWLNLSLNEQSTREHWTGILQSGNIVPYTFQTQMLIPSNEMLLYGCASIESPLFTQETNMDNNRVCVSLTNDFTILNVYPNPASDEANVLFSIPFNGAISLKISSSSGELIKDISYTNYPKGISTIKIPLDNIGSGLYILELSFNGKTERRKLAME